MTVILKNTGNSQNQKETRMTKKALFTNILLTVHLSVTIVHNQIDSQLLYFIIRLLYSSTCIEQRRAHQQQVKFY